MNFLFEKMSVLFARNDVVFKDSLRVVIVKK